MPICLTINLIENSMGLDSASPSIKKACIYISHLNKIESKETKK
jgi:hypothetical protein